MTKNYKVRSEIMSRELPALPDKAVIAIDGGYSSVKGVGNGRVFSFPSLAKRIPGELNAIGEIRPTDLQVRNNKTGEMWLVGETAELLLKQSDIDGMTDASLYARYRYDSDIYRIIMATGITLGLDTDREFFLQTGLPASYKARDEKKLRSVLAGEYDISIKIGNGNFQRTEFTLDEDHIMVMEQPMGTLCAAAYKDGIPAEEGKRLLSSNTIVLDIGFGTEDIFSVEQGYDNNGLSHRTYSDTGMRAVFSNVIERIQKEYPAEYKVFEFQRYLESGKAPYFDEENMRMHYVDFGSMLEEENQLLCRKSIKRLLQDYNNLYGYNYLIVTGGTGESRFLQIKQMLSGAGPEIIPGNMNCPDLPFIYSNVIGYYMYRYSMCKKMENTDAV